jgi:hypothetical protein
MLFTEWKRRAHEERPTMVPVVPIEVSCKVSMKRTRKPMKRFSLKLLDGSTEKPLLDRFKNTEVEPPHKLLLVSRSSQPHITPDEEEPTDEKPKQCCTTVEQASEIEERDPRAATTLNSIWVTLPYLVEEERRDLLQVRFPNSLCSCSLSSLVFTLCIYNTIPSILTTPLALIPFE